MPEGAIYAVLKQVRTITASVTTSSSLILDADPDVKGTIIYNDSDDSVYLTYGPTAAVANATKVIGPHAAWDIPGPAVWCGEISAIRESGSGVLVITSMI